MRRVDTLDAGPRRHSERHEGGERRGHGEPSEDESLAAVVLDERLFARRAETDAARRHRRRTVFVLVAVAIGALALLAVAVLESGYLDVQSVRVRGVHHLDARTVLAVSRLHDGEAMIGLDTHGAVERISDLAWVERVHVERHWPHDVVIVVREYQASAWLRLSPTRVALLGRDGRVLSDARRAPPGVVQVTGVRVLPKVGALLYPPGVGRVADALPAALARRLVAVDVAGEGARLVLRDGSRVELGELTDLDAKAAAALAVLDHTKACTIVDVSVPAAPAAEACTG